MSNLDSFRALYCSGSFVPDPDAVTALSLLFEKVYLPNDIEIICEFSRNFRIRNESHMPIEVKFKPVGDASADPFAELSKKQRETAFQYLASTVMFAQAYLPLYGDVFESPCFPDGSPLDAELIRKGGPGELNTYRVSLKKSMQFRSEESDKLSKLINDGYVPVVGSFSPTSLIKHLVDDATSAQIASLLAMNAVRLILPRTRSASPTIILEARERLSDHLPPFWAAMLKLTRDLRSRISDGCTETELNAEAQNFVDEIVRPALIELKHKLMLERKQWFFRILSPIQKGLRLLVGNPPLTQQQLLTNAMILGSDVAMAGASHFQQIDALKNSSGLTMLLKAEQLLDEDKT